MTKCDYCGSSFLVLQPKGDTAPADHLETYHPSTINQIPPSEIPADYRPGNIISTQPSNLSSELIAAFAWTIAGGIITALIVAVIGLWPLFIHWIVPLTILSYATWLWLIHDDGPPEKREESDDESIQTDEEE